MRASRRFLARHARIIVTAGIAQEVNELGFGF
jgi:hypothetical protein